MGGGGESLRGSGGQQPRARAPRRRPALPPSGPPVRGAPARAGPRLPGLAASGSRYMVPSSPAPSGLLRAARGRALLRRGCRAWGRATPGGGSEGGGRAGCTEPRSRGAGAARQPSRPPAEHSAAAAASAAAEPPPSGLGAACARRSVCECVCTRPCVCVCVSACVSALGAPPAPPARCRAPRPRQPPPPAPAAARCRPRAALQPAPAAARSRPEGTAAALRPTRPQLPWGGHDALQLGSSILRMPPHCATPSARALRVTAASNPARPQSPPPPPRCSLTPLQKSWKSSPCFPIGGGSRASARDSTLRWSRKGRLVCVKTRNGFFCQAETGSATLAILKLAHKWSQNV